MIFMLGFLVAGLVALFFLPAFWRRALRLSKRRLEMLMPLSMEEIIAERDQLRAESALAQRQVEQKARAINAARIEDMGELGRRAKELADLTARLDETRQAKAALARELKITQDERHDALSQQFGITQGLHAVETLYLNHRDALATLQDKHNKLNALSDERRAMIAGLEDKVKTLESHLDESEQRHAHVLSALGTLKSEHAKLNTLSDERRAVISSLETKVKQLEANLNEAEQRQSDLTISLTSKIHDASKLGLERDATIKTLLSTQASLEAAEQTAQSLRGENMALQAQHESLAAELRIERAQLEKARHDLATLSTHEAELKTKLAALQAVALPTGDTIEDENKILRQAIMDVGTKLLHLAPASDTQTAHPDATNDTGRVQDRAAS